VIEVDADYGWSQIGGVSPHRDDSRSVFPDDLPSPVPARRPACCDGDSRADCELMNEPADEVRVAA
jgi:hypothetical protein